MKNMAMWRCEMKKALVTQKGLLILAICIFLRLLTAAMMPELKDDRIKMSQKQYDRYLAVLHGANTPEKSEFIISERDNCESVKAAQASMEMSHREGVLSEEEWREWQDELEQAYLHENSSKLWTEKAEQFAGQDEALAPAHYFYEYGWQTVFFLLSIPDALTALVFVFLAAQSIGAERSSGMLSILLTAKEGRGRLYAAKLSTILVICLAAGLLGAVLETAVFAIRGFLREGGIPIYSETFFATDCPLRLSLWQGYLIIEATRIFGALCLAAFTFGLSAWIKKASNLMAVCVAIVGISFLIPVPTLFLFTFGGILSGSRLLLTSGQTGIPILLPVLAAFLYGVVSCIVGYVKYVKPA